MDLFALFLFSSLVAFVYALVKEKSYLKYIYVCIALGFILLKYASPAIGTRGLILVTALIVHFVFYGALKKGLNPLGRAAITSAAACVGLMPIINAFFLPFNHWLPLFNIVPVVLGIAWYLTSKPDDDTELSPFILLIPFALIQLLVVFVGFG